MSRRFCAQRNKGVLENAFVQQLLMSVVFFHDVHSYRIYASDTRSRVIEIPESGGSLRWMVF